MEHVGRRREVRILGRRTYLEGNLEDLIHDEMKIVIKLILQVSVPF